MSAVPASVKLPLNVTATVSAAPWFGPALTTGGTFETETVAVSVPAPPSSSVTVRVAVYDPLSAYACVATWLVEVAPSPKAHR